MRDSAERHEPWWPSFFDELYADLELEGRHAEHLPATIEFLAERLRLEPGMRVFDQCCGIGRLSLPLAERGLHVIGVDLTEAYVRRAAARAGAADLPCRFFTGDAFEFVADEPCHAAINWFTSFGYSHDDEANERMVRCAFDSLRPGGRWALDYMSLPRVFADFRPHVIQRRTPPDGDEAIVLIESWADFELGMIDSDWTFVLADGTRRTRRVSTKAYLPHELAAMARRVGFADVELVGSIAGESFQRNSPRCIVIARKPGA